MVVAPLIMLSPEGIFQYMVKTEILFGAPIFLVRLVGYFSRRVSARAANLTMISYLVTLALFQHVIDTGIHFLHVLALLFTVHVAMLFALSRLYPNDRHPAPSPRPGQLDLRPWKFLPHASVLLVGAMLLMYVVFSRWGLIDAATPKEVEWGFVAFGLVLAAAIFGLPAVSAHRRRRMAARPAPATVSESV